MQQQMELEAKRMRQQMNITSLGGVAGQVIDGSLQLIQTTDGKLHYGLLTIT